jgi:ATP-dependent helicase/nuclease subunit A
MILSPEQRRAATRTGQDVCVVAGPGSGKTRVLVERFRWRVAGGFSPLRILAITFTEKAANEIKDRLARDFAHEPERRREIERAPVYTIDGFCMHLLREYAIEAGIDPQFGILDAEDASAELTEAAECALDEMVREQPEAMRRLFGSVNLRDAIDDLTEAVKTGKLLSFPKAGDGPAAGGEWDRLRAAAGDIAAAAPSPQLEELQAWARSVLALPDGATREHFRVLGEFQCNLTKLKRNNSAYAAIRSVKQDLLKPARQALASMYFAPLGALLRETVERIDREYRLRKQALGTLDFADLEAEAIRLLESNATVRERVQASYEEILMDEYQDTNPLQARLVELIRRPGRFFAVGDPNQSIYGFRHADPGVFRKYRESVPAVDQMKENYRSRAPILTAAQAVADGLAGVERRELDPKREFPPEREPCVEVVQAADPDTEGRWIARRIIELEAPFGDVALLLRNTNALPPIEAALREAGVPYRIGRGKQFYEAREVTDLVHLLRVLDNSRDEVSMAAVLRSPLAGVGSETLLRLKERGNLGAAVMEIHTADGIGFDPADLERLRAFRTLAAGLRERTGDVPPDRLLAEAMDASGYVRSLAPHARANARKLLARIRGWHESNPRPLARLVRDLERLRASDPDETSAPPEESSDAVQVLTAHSAKGLQFPVVFLAATHKGGRRDAPPVVWAPGRGLAARWLDPATNTPVEDLLYAGYLEERKRLGEEEENRLLYVAMTRAEGHLALSFARGARAPANWAGKIAKALKVRVLEAGEAARVASRPANRPEESAPEAISPPAAADASDSSASVTSIAEYAVCPRKYYLGSYLGWKSVAEGNAPKLSLGSQVHELLAGNDVPDASPEAVELVRRFHAGPLGRRTASASRIEREFDFLMEVEGLILDGRIDLWFEEGGEAVLVDYKTDHVDREGALDRARSYTLQLQIYALALERLLGRLPEHAYLSFLRAGINVPVPAGKEDVAGAVQVVREFTRAQSELSFPEKPGDACARCPFHRGLCRA